MSRCTARAVHLATAAEHAGHDPIIISDIDPQGTSGDWFNQWKKSGFDTPLYAPLALPELRGTIQALNEAGAAYLFIDTTPFIGAVNNPTPADLRALVKGLPLVRQSGKPFSFVLARVWPNLKNNDGAAMALEALGLPRNVIAAPAAIR